MIQPTRRYVLRWLSTVSYHARGELVEYLFPQTCAHVDMPQVQRIYPITKTVVISSVIFIRSLIFLAEFICDIPISRRNNPFPLHVISSILYCAILFWPHSTRGLQERHTVDKCWRKAARIFCNRCRSTGQWCNAMESKVINATHSNTQNGSALSLSLRNVVCKGLRTSEAVCDARKQPKMQMYNWDARGDNKWVKSGNTNLNLIYSISGLVGEQVQGIGLFCILCFFLFLLNWYECLSFRSKSYVNIIV